MRILIALLAISIAGYATSQRNPMGMTARLMLIVDPSVKKEVKLTKEQDRAIQEVMKSAGETMKTGFPEGFDMSNPMAFLDPKLAELLSVDQMLRLDGIFMQANLGFALSDARIAGLVKLTEAQSQQVAEGAKAAQDEMVKVMTNRPSTSALKGLAKKRIEAGENILKILDEAQTKIFNDALGKPFKFRG